MSVVVQRDDGGVAILAAVPGVTPEDQAASLPPGTAYAIVESLPDDGLRYAWRIVDGALVVDEDTKPPVPEMLTPIQMELALILAPERLAWAEGMDLVAAVASYIESLPAREQAILTTRRNRAVQVVTSDDALLQGAAAAGFTQEQIDDLLRLAATL